MNRWYFFLVFMAVPTVILAQPGTSQYHGPNYASQPYTPAVPAPSMTTAYGGYPGYYGAGGSAAGSALNGMSSVISAKGNYNLSTSAAAINMTEAKKNSIQNQQLGAQTYFEMRAANRAAAAAGRGPTPTMEQMARWARDAAPKPITPSEVDPSTGRIYWPAWLRESSFAPQRAELDQLLAKKVTYGGLSISDQMQAERTIDTMFRQLNSQIKDIRPQDYVASRTFLSSLIYATSGSQLE